MPRAAAALLTVLPLLSPPMPAGTPLQNNMVELYGMLAFMYPDVFTTPGPFEAAFNLVKGTVSGAKELSLLSSPQTNSLPVRLWHLARLLLACD